MLRLLTTFFLSVLFLAAYGQDINSVAIIGSATPGGWDAETPMTQDAENPAVWTISLTLVDGAAKFRANNAWDVNWGDTGFPLGTGVQNGPDIAIVPGQYNVTINSETGAYFFDLTSSDIGIIGSSTPFGWDREVFMFRDAADENKYFVTLDKVQGAAKFRANGGWDVNWGSTDFPSGTGTQGGDDIPVPQAGTYTITFDKATGEYNFTEQVDYTSIGVIGSATPAGWDQETALTKDGGNPDIWRGVIALTVGEIKFRADSAWTVNWGGMGFPTGTGVLNGDNIPVGEAGNYIITFNTNTLEYSFVLIVPYDVVSIIGEATPGGWEADTDMERDANDESIWKLRVVLTTGEAKFRANNDWAVNWGGGDFPNGVATLDGPNIPVAGGEYRVTFNSTTGEYSFVEIVEYAAVSLVGRSGPFGAWPEADDMGARDAFLNKDPNDGNLWTYPSATLTTSADETDGGIKFRADTAWTINWGAAEFPAGVGTFNGPNIMAIAGTYSITFNAATGEYAFGNPLSAGETLLSPADVKLAPNPTRGAVRITVDTDKLGNNLTVTVYDMMGRQVMIKGFDRRGDILLDVSGLQAGNYTVHITDGRAFIGKQLSVAR